MKLKVLRNLGNDWPFHKVAAGGKPAERYMENHVYDVEDELGDKMLKHGVAEVDDGTTPQPLRGVSSAPGIATPADFGKNPSKKGE